MAFDHKLLNDLKKKKNSKRLSPRYLATFQAISEIFFMVLFRFYAKFQTFKKKKKKRSSYTVQSTSYFLLIIQIDQSNSARCENLYPKIKQK